MAGSLKRKFDQLLEEDDSSLCSSSSLSSWGCSPSSSVSPAWDPEEEGPWDRASLPDRNGCGPQSSTPASILKRGPRKRPRRVAFSGTTVFYFPRCQGFTSVPSRGGCTLGMAPRHSACRRFSLAEFALEQAGARQERLRLRLKEEKLEVLRAKLTEAGVPEAEAGLTLDAVDDASVDEEVAAAVAGGRLEDMASLQPYPARGRRALLRAAGVRKIDREEKRELQALRQSREDCGCRCDGVCDPDTCSCSLAGIKCQMDHTAFPCGCCKEGCENPRGRVEFNQERVQTHLLHTLTRLQLEQGAERPGELEAPALAGPPSPGGQAPAPAFPLASELGDHSCSSDMTDSSAASGAGEAPDGPAHPALPGPGLQPGAGDDSLEQILRFSDSDPGAGAEGEEGEEEEEEQGGVGNLDNLSIFHLADVFGSGDPGGPAGWAHSYSSASFASGILDENANLDASCFLGSGLEGLGEGSLPGTEAPPSLDAGQGSSVDLSWSSCDSFELLQALPDYRLGPHYASRKAPDGPGSWEAPRFAPPGDAGGACFLESILGLSEPAAEDAGFLLGLPVV